MPTHVSWAFELVLVHMQQAINQTTTSALVYPVYRVAIAFIENMATIYTAQCFSFLNAISPKKKKKKRLIMQLDL